MLFFYQHWFLLTLTKQLAVYSSNPSLLVHEYSILINKNKTILMLLGKEKQRVFTLFQMTSTRTAFSWKEKKKWSKDYKMRFKVVDQKIKSWKRY